MSSYPSAEDLFDLLSRIADAKDVAANGPNRPQHRRSLHAVALTMGEILEALAALPNEAPKVCRHAYVERSRDGRKEYCECGALFRPATPDQRPHDTPQGGAA